MEKIKQNKKYFIIVPIIILILTCFIFADWEDGHLPVISTSSADASANGLVFRTYNGNPQRIASQSYDSIYCFYVGNDLYIVSDLQNAGVWGHYTSYTSITTTYDNTFYYMIAGNIGNVHNASIPVFNSLNDGFESFSSYISSIPSTTSKKLNYSLPPGNAAFIEVSSDNTFTLNTRFNEISGLFNGVFSKTSQTWGWSSTIVESGSFPLSGHNLIPWAKGDTQNLLGQSHFGFATSNSLTGSGKYLVIYNPLYSYQTDSESNFEHNYSIDISCTSVYSISIVSLKGNLASGIESSWSLTSTPDGTVYTDNGIDSETGIPTFVNQDGEDAIPEYGGSNFVATQTESFKEWLNSVVGSFLSIFTAGENAIMTLVHYGQGFFSILTSLYAWLPQSVFSVLTSGIVLVITIGIIKVFL